MDKLLPRIKDILAEKPNDAQLDKFLGDLRESLATSNKQFINFEIFAVTALVTYHLIAYEGATSFSLNSVQIGDTALFRRSFLVVPAALLSAVACIGYLRRCQREVYDYLAISRYPILGKTGLHELRLPSDYILGLFLLRDHGNIVAKTIGNILALLSLTVFTFAPAIYVIHAAIENVSLFGKSDLLAIVASSIAITLSICSLFVVWFGVRIKAT